MTEVMVVEADGVVVVVAASWPYLGRQYWHWTVVAVAIVVVVVHVVWLVLAESSRASY